MLTTSDYREKEEKRYFQARDAAIDALVDALCERYRELTGKHATDKMRDEFWQTVRGAS